MNNRVKKIIMENLPMTPDHSAALASLKDDVISDLVVVGVDASEEDYHKSLLELKQEQCLVIYNDKVTPTQYGINLYT